MFSGLDYRLSETFFFFGDIACLMSPLHQFQLAIHQILCPRDLRIFPPLVVIGGAEIAQSVYGLGCGLDYPGIMARFHAVTR